MDDEIYTQDTLARTFIRARDADGRWGNVDLATATDAQFDRWIRTKILVGDDGYGSAWSIYDRLCVCKRLAESGHLVWLRKEKADD